VKPFLFDIYDFSEKRLGDDGTRRSYSRLGAYP
jgi:hypothetical protein